MKATVADLTDEEVVDFLISLSLEFHAQGTKDGLAGAQLMMTAAKRLQAYSREAKNGGVGKPAQASADDSGRQSTDGVGTSNQKAG